MLAIQDKTVTRKIIKADVCFVIFEEEKPGINTQGDLINFINLCEIICMCFLYKRIYTECAEGRYKFYIKKNKNEIDVRFVLKS